MTYHEIVTAIQEHQKMYELEVKNKLYMNYNLATTIAVMVCSGFAGKKPPKFENLYPNIDKEVKDITPEKQADFIKAQLFAFSENYNKKNYGNKDDK